MLPQCRNKVPGQIKQGGGLDLAPGPGVCRLCTRCYREFDLTGKAREGFPKGETWKVMVRTFMFILKAIETIKMFQTMG